MRYVVDINGELPKTGALKNAKRLCIGSELEDILGEFCDSYCKFPDMAKTEMELYEKHCNGCPINYL